MSSVFKGPLRLVFTEPSTGKLCIENYVLDQISKITKQINSVSITGIYRSGKSYLLTRLAGQYKGFPLGSTVESLTKGIWVWCVEHPVYSDQVLLLMDTEGLEDVKKDNANHDIQLFTLALLLSSTLIYNTFGVLDAGTLEKLNFVTEISKHVQTSSSAASSDTDFDKYFPELILSLRDFSLDLEINGHAISSDEYLEDSLRAKEGNSEAIEQYNAPRLCLRKYFKQMKCFVFDTPANKSKMRIMDTLTDSDLSPDFVEDTKRFLHYVHNEGTPMKLMNGTPVSGRMFANLASNYVDAIRSGAIPCIQSALRSMATIENEKATEEAFTFYREMMQENVVLPTKDLQTLSGIHLESNEQALDHFLAHCVLDDDDKYKEKFDSMVNEEYVRIQKMNEDKSNENCKAALENLHAKIAANIRAGVYAVPGGHDQYSIDRESLKFDYDALSDLGVMKETVFVEFEHYMQNESDAILKSDQNLTEKEKALRHELEERRIAQERVAMVEQKLQQSFEDLQMVNDKHKKEIKKRIKANKREMEKERARDERINKKREEEISRLNNENLGKVEKQYKEELAKEREAQKQRDKELSGKLEHLGEELEKVKLEEKLKEKQRERKEKIERDENQSRIPKLPWPFSNPFELPPRPPKPGPCF